MGTASSNTIKAEKMNSPHESYYIEDIPVIILSDEGSSGTTTPPVIIETVDPGENYTYYFLAHLSMDCSVSYCDHSPSVGIRATSVCPMSVRPSVHNLLVNTLASTNINQSSPNLVKMYMTTRARMSFIMELI